MEGIALGTSDDDVDAIVINCDGSTFFSGADLEELEGGIKPPGLLEFINACEISRKPIIGALHGTVFGGGVVVAYACDYRIAANDTRFAMPEVALGLLPTFGGTQYLPRMLGIQGAMELIIDGVQWSSERALKEGLIDYIAKPEELNDRAAQLAGVLKSKRRTRDQTRHRIPSVVSSRLYEMRREHLRQSSMGFDAPMVCLEAMENGLALPLEEALRKEHEAFLGLLQSAQSKRLRSLFLAERKLRRSDFDRPKIEKALLAVGHSRAEIQQIAHHMIETRAVPNAQLLDALIVNLFNLPRHEPSWLDAI